MSERVPESSSSSENSEESLSNRTRETGQTLKELVNSLGIKSKALAEQKSAELKEAAKDDKISAKDAARHSDAWKQYRKHNYDL